MAAGYSDDPWFHFSSHLGDGAVIDRQWRLLKRRTPTGLYWLLQQMAAWPRRYIRHQWMDLSSILGLYR